VGTYLGARHGHDEDKGNGWRPTSVPDSCVVLWKISPRLYGRFSASQQVNQGKAINQGINQSINQAINESIKESINQSIKQSINQSMNQSTN
jgi:hypothetical protein